MKSIILEKEKETLIQNNKELLANKEKEIASAHETHSNLKKTIDDQKQQFALCQINLDVAAKELELANKKIAANEDGKDISTLPVKIEESVEYTSLKNTHVEQIKGLERAAEAMAGWISSEYFSIFINRFRELISKLYDCKNAWPGWGSSLARGMWAPCPELPCHCIPVNFVVEWTSPYGQEMAPPVFPLHTFFQHLFQALLQESKNQEIDAHLQISDPVFKGSYQSQQDKVFCAPPVWLSENS